MEEKMMRFWINLCGIVQEKHGMGGNYSLAERCPLCSSGLQQFEISKNGNDWSCLGCGERGDIWGLLCQLHSPEIAKKELEKYGLKKSEKKAVGKNGKK